MQEYYFPERGISYRKNEFQMNRPTLVWIHGLSGSASAWFPYEKIFDEYNLLTLDLRGHGTSGRPKRYRDYELNLFADDVYELLEHLHIAKCSMVSHSFGTLVALELANAHTEKIAAMIFLSPTSFLDTTQWFLLIRTVGKGLIALCRIVPFRSKRRGRVDYSIFTYTSDWDMRRIVRDVYTTTVHSYLYCLGQAYAKNYNEVWRTISVPTLILHGTRDGYIPLENSVRLSREIPQSTLIRLENANHIIVLNNISEVSGHIKDFLSSQ